MCWHCSIAKQCLRISSFVQKLSNFTLLLLLARQTKHAFFVKCSGVELDNKRLEDSRHNALFTLNQIFQWHAKLCGSTIVASTTTTTTTNVFGKRCQRWRIFEWRRSFRESCSNFASKISKSRFVRRRRRRRSCGSFRFKKLFLSRLSIIIV